MDQGDRHTKESIAPTSCPHTPVLPSMKGAGSLHVSALPWYVLQGTQDAGPAENCRDLHLSSRQS